MWRFQGSSNRIPNHVKSALIDKIVRNRKKRGFEGLPSADVKKPKIETVGKLVSALYFWQNEKKMYVVVRKQKWLCVSFSFLFVLLL